MRGEKDEVEERGEVTGDRVIWNIARNAKIAKDRRNWKTVDHSGHRRMHRTQRKISDRKIAKESHDRNKNRKLTTKTRVLPFNFGDLWAILAFLAIERTPAI